MNCRDCFFYSKHESDGINPEWHECTCDIVSGKDNYWDNYGMEDNNAEENCDCFCRDENEVRVFFEGIA